MLPLFEKSTVTVPARRLATVEGQRIESLILGQEKKKKGNSQNNVK